MVIAPGTWDEHRSYRFAKWAVCALCEAIFVMFSLLFTVSLVSYVDFFYYSLGCEACLREGGGDASEQVCARSVLYKNLKY